MNNSFEPSTSASSSSWPKSDGDELTGAGAPSSADDNSDAQDSTLQPPSLLTTAALPKTSADPSTLSTAALPRTSADPSALSDQLDTESDPMHGEPSDWKSRAIDVAAQLKSKAQERPVAAGLAGLSLVLISAVLVITTTGDSGSTGGLLSGEETQILADGANDNLGSPTVDALASAEGGPLEANALRPLSLTGAIDPALADPEDQDAEEETPEEDTTTSTENSTTSSSENSTTSSENSTTSSSENSTTSSEKSTTSTQQPTTAKEQPVSVQSAAPKTSPPAAPSTKAPTTKAPTTKAPTTKAPTTAKPAPAGNTCSTGAEFESVFWDDFNGSSLGGQWLAYNDPNPDFGTLPGATGRRSPEAISVNNGLLTITGSERDGKAFTGGMEHKLNVKYGRFRFKVRADNDPSKVFSGVVLTWPQSQNQKAHGENNIFETLADTPNRDPFFSFIHKPNGVPSQQQYKPHYADGSRWQTMTMEWTPSRITLKREGPGGSGYDEWTVNENGNNIIPDAPHHLAIQLDSWRNYPPSQSVRLQVDWVEVAKYCG